jgi:hypothetical protein
VAVAVRGAKPGAELWSVSDAAPAVIQRKPLADTSDGEDLRVEWLTDRWVLSNDGGPTTVVPAALLTNRPQAPGAASAAGDPGEGGFSPFAVEAASAPAAANDDGLPWTWIAIAAVLLAATAGVFVVRARQPKTVLRKPHRR